MPDFASICRNIDYEFNNRELLIQALTHSSVTRNKHKNYERLEFLGDRILGMTIAHLLYNMFPNDDEGKLSRRFTQLVRAETVAEMARRLKLDEYIVAQDKETSTRMNVLCDVCEAIIGAIYIDSDIASAISFVEKHWNGFLAANVPAQKDHKTSLQEYLQKHKQSFPMYEVIEKSGEEHNPLFKVKVSSENGYFALGDGHSKKEAEQNAALELLKILEEKDE